MTDPRGGHNQYKFNKRFFTRWTPRMAYVLGFLFADGNISNATSSRTQYVSFSNTEKEILEKIKIVLQSEHPIYSRAPRMVRHCNGEYLSRESFVLRIGSRQVFGDLMTLGVIPRKSKVVKFPRIPRAYFPHFVRGYFDGDGCIYVERGVGKTGRTISKRVRAIFVSGSLIYLKGLKRSLLRNGVENGKIYKGTRSFHLVYPTHQSIRLFKLIYSHCGTLFLSRKRNTFLKYMKGRRKTRKFANLN